MSSRLPSLTYVLPPRSMVGQLPLEQHIGVRIPGGQPAESKRPIPVCKSAKQPQWYQ